MKAIIYLTILYHIFFNGVYALEQPKYKVLKEYKKFEIREYSPYLVAEVEVDTTFENIADKGFQILFQYISGNNVKNEEISMTVPVNQTNAGEKIAMTVPVTQKPKLKSKGTYILSFVLPSKYTLETAPIPKDSRVKIKEIPSKIVAVREYSGTWSEKNYRKNESLLIEELKNSSIKMIGDPIFARYDPPIMPWFLRSNEVIIEVDYLARKILN